MRKVTTIVAFAAAIMMAGAVAQAQVKWNEGIINSGVTGNDFGRDVTGTSTVAKGITNFYHAAGTVAGAGNIANYFVTGGQLGSGLTNTGTITNYWLQVGVRPGLNRDFGSDVTGIVTLNDNSIQLGNTTVNRSASYGVDISSTGTLGTLNFNGGTVRNAGTINNLILGTGFNADNYSGTGSVGTVGFSGNFDVATDISKFGASNYNLVGANLTWNVEEDKFSAGLFSWADIFGVAGNFNALKLNDDEEYEFALASLTINDIVFNAANGWASQIFGLDVTIGATGANVTPEPATLAVLGLGLAGLGLARRRRK